MNISRRRLASSSIAASTLPLLNGTAKAASGAATSSAAVPATLGYPTPLSTLPPGAYSHWLQPWRTMIETRPLATFTGGVGIQEPDFTTSDATFAMIAASGIRHLRLGLQWGLFQAANPASLGANAAAITGFVQRAQAHGLRPLVLLDAIDGAPCPFTSTVVKLAAAYTPGDGVLHLSSTSGMVAGHSGPTAFLPVGDFYGAPIFLSPAMTMAPALFTAISGNIATLSKELPCAIGAGAYLAVNTLLYRPFGAVGTADTEATMLGWLAYVDAVAAFMTAALGTAGKADLGFDLEIWNELSFGSAFLDIDNYYAVPIVPENTQAVPPIIPAIVARTAAHIDAAPARYAGVRASDGFANTIPWPAASTEPARVTALSKHWYPSVQNIPADDRGVCLDAHGVPTSFAPSYVAYNAELAASALPVFTIARDIADETTYFGPVGHGRLARTTVTSASGAVTPSTTPVPMWITEFGVATASVGVTGAASGASLSAKGVLRGVFFHLGIGVERIYLFQGRGNTQQFALIDQAAPATQTLALAALGRAMTWLAAGAPATGAGSLRSHGFSATMVGAPRKLFAGNGTSACPDMMEPADLVILPIQVSPTRTAFVYWLIGTDMRVNAAATAIDVTITGIDGMTAKAAAYDPVTGSPLAATVVAGTATGITLQLAVTDTPRLLSLTGG